MELLTTKKEKRSKKKVLQRNEASNEEITFPTRKEKNLKKILSFQFEKKKTKIVTKLNFKLAFNKILISSFRFNY